MPLNRLNTRTFNYIRRYSSIYLNRKKDVKKYLLGAGLPEVDYSIVRGNRKKIKKLVQQKYS